MHSSSYTVEPSVLLMPESIQAGGSAGSGAISKGKKDASASGFSVCGSNSISLIPPIVEPKTRYGVSS